MIDWSYRLESECVCVSLRPGARDKGFFLKHDGDNVSIVCPEDTDFKTRKTQEFLYKVIIEILRNKAKQIIPPRLKALAEINGLSYKSIKINSSRSRWGSCSSLKSINISLFTVLLPKELQDFILLHELTHTLEMNHSSRFHAKLDAMLGGREKELNLKLKNFRTTLYS